MDYVKFSRADRISLKYSNYKLYGLWEIYWAKILRGSFINIAAAGLIAELRAVA